MIELFLNCRLDAHCIANNKKAWTQQQDQWTGLTVGKVLQMPTYKHNPPHPNGRHPLNIITGEML